ncbi:ROK family glucokinase [Actinomycetaceae bacterium L2_0104]
MHAIGIDVGGTKIAAGLVDEEGKVLKEIRRPTPATDGEAVAKTICDMALELANGEDVAGIGIGAAGFCNADRDTVVYAPNLDWRNEPLAEMITACTSLPVVVENDANAAAWGEYRFGAARGSRNATVVTLGTGIGGGVIIDGQLIRGSQGFAAEIGHMQIKAGGRRCGCGNRGCWERYGSGTALVQEAREMAQVAPDIAYRILELADGKIENITGPLVAQAARGGDANALDIIETVARWIGLGLADLAAILDPEVFVLAGGMARDGEMLRAPVQAAFEQNVTARKFRKLPPIKLAELGVPAGLIGAADLARQ